MNDKKKCEHKNTKTEGGYIVCRDCGIVLGDDLEFEGVSPINEYSDSQREYESAIRRRDSRSKQYPKIKKHYNKILTL